MTIDSKVEFAWGADLTADPATWTWTEETIRVRGDMSHTFGAQDEAGQTQPSTIAFRLDNVDQRYSPRHPLSALYPNVRRQTPVRASLDPTTGFSLRFQGYIDEIKPDWPDGEEGIAEVQVTASGILRRLGQGQPALRSAMFRAYVQSAPVAYWPLEDGPDAAWADSPIAGVGPMSVRPGSVVAWSAASGPDGSSSVAGFARSGMAGVLVGTVPPAPSATSWRVEHSVSFGALQPGGFAESLRWDTAGTIAQWEVVAAEQSNGGLYVQYVTSGGASGGPFKSGVRVDDTLWHHVRVDAAQSGADIALTVTLDGVAVISQTITSATLGMITPVYTNPTGVADESAPEIGHIAVWAPWTSSVDTYQAFLGYAGETARDRIIRLCTEEGIPYSVSSSTETRRMGPQTATTVLALLRECEAADGGILYDGFGPGISYVAALDRSSLAVTMALDCNRQQVGLPFSPAEDDQRLRNRWTVARLNGSQGATYTNTEHSAANGGVIYADSTSLNVSSDTVLLDEAGWRVNLGTVEEMRVPGIALELIDHPELWSSWLAMRPGLRMIADSLPAQYPPGTLDMALEGAAETWNAVSWRVEANTSPYAPWRVAVFAADVGDTGEFVGRFDTDGSELAAAASATATTLTVATTVPTAEAWTLATDDWPFDVGVAGERITVTAVASAVTDNFARTVSNGWGTATSGQAWTVTATASDYSTTGTVGRIATTTINSLYYAVLDTLSTDQRAQVTITLPVVPATAPITLREVVRYADANNYYEAELQIATSGTATLVISKRVAGTRTQLASAGVIGSHAAGNSWTIVVDIAASTLTARAWNASTGSDPVFWQISASDTSLTSGTLAGAGVRRETSNTNGTVNVDFDNFLVPNPQTFTVRRSVNTVVKAQQARAPLSLWAPPVFAK